LLKVLKIWKTGRIIAGKFVLFFGLDVMSKNELFKNSPINQGNPV